MPDTPDEIARANIDAQLASAGWVVQNVAELNLSAARGVAIRELESRGVPVKQYQAVDARCPLPA